MTDSVAPCPICKSRLVSEFERQTGLHVVSCENDDCHFVVEALGSTAAEAVRQWNTRAKDTPADLVSVGEREALKPFARAADWFDVATIGLRDEKQEPYPDDHTVAVGFDIDGKCLHITVGDCRKARTALSQRDDLGAEAKQPQSPQRDALGENI